MWQAASRRRKKGKGDEILRAQYRHRSGGGGDGSGIHHPAAQKGRKPKIHQMETGIQLTRMEQLALIGAKNVLTMQEAALYIGYKVSSLYVLCSRREIPYYKRGKNNYFNKSELDDWMAGERVETGAELRQKADYYLFSKNQ